MLIQYLRELADFKLGFRSLPGLLFLIDLY